MADVAEELNKILIFFHFHEFNWKMQVKAVLAYLIVPTPLGEE